MEGQSVHLTWWHLYFWKGMLSKLKTRSWRKKDWKQEDRLWGSCSHSDKRLCLPFPKVYQNVRERKATHFPGSYPNPADVHNVLGCMGWGGSHGFYHIRQCFSQLVRGTEPPVLCQEKDPISCYGDVGNVAFAYLANVSWISGTIAQQYFRSGWIALWETPICLQKW